MVTEERIKKAIEEKEIEIVISFQWKDNQLVQFETAQPLLNSALQGNLYSDRLKLTMGPIVKVLSSKPVSPKYRYKGTSDCFDLRKSDNKYVINPGESIILLTNEKIRLNGKYVCLILPRISLSDVGLVVSTAYVDPYYEGLMRLHLINLSDNPYEIKTLEPIAQCFFFEMTNNVLEKYKDNFPQKSVFFGQTWQEVLSTEREPFPTKKKSLSGGKFSDLKYQLGLIWMAIKKHSLIIWLLANISVIIMGWTSFNNNFTKYTEQVAKIQEWLNPAAIEIVINSGETVGRKQITVDFPKADIVSVLCNNDDIHYKIISGNTESETSIEFTYVLNAPAQERYEIDFSYIIVRRPEK